MMYKVLVVDDEAANTRTLERLLREEYEVVSAGSGDEGLEMLNLHDVALIISDQRMPGMTGVEFLKRSAEVRPNCVRIILTGYTDAPDLVDALNSGVVYKYVTKPWVNTDLLQTVKRGLAHHETLKAQHRLNLENERIQSRLIGLEDNFMKVCVEMLGFRNELWRERAGRVRDSAMKVGNALQLDPVALVTLSHAAYLHGMADVFAPHGLLTRKEKLTENEKTFLVSIRERGLKLLENLTGSQEIILAIRHVPEHYDGSAWPAGLSGVQIPLNSQIIAVAKAYDELLFPDSASIGLSETEAMAELHAASRKKFDPAVVNAFCGLMAIDQVQRMIPIDQLPTVAAFG